MEGRPLLSVQGLGDEHVAADGVYVVDPTGRLVGARSRDAVADSNVLVLIRADLETEPEKNRFNKEAVENIDTRRIELSGVCDTFSIEFK